MRPITEAEVMERIDKGIRRAVARALLKHKKEGWPIVIWRDGKVVEIPANEILVDQQEADWEPQDG